MVDKVFWPVVRWMLDFFLVVVRLLLRCSRLLLGYANWLLGGF